MTAESAKLTLEDGTVFCGKRLGAEGESLGEVVFNTSLTGYQEVFTDASYNGQIVVMTNPLIGNYGMNRDDEEYRRPHIRGVVVRESSRRPSNFRSEENLDTFLKRHGIVGISGVDTRAITKRIRVSGSLKGVLSTEGTDDASSVEKARAWSGLEGLDMVKDVTCTESHHWTQGFSSPFSECFVNGRDPGKLGEGLKIAAFDFGVKFNILRILHEMGFEVHVLPAGTSADAVRALKPDGVFLSNGPGDPAGIPYVCDTVRALIGEFPIFGICLGHQILAIALGAHTYKLKFGHHGGNHPVMNLRTGKVEISVQNHCYAADLRHVDSDLVES